MLEDSLALDLSINSAIKAQQMQNAQFAAQFMAWNQLAINLTHPQKHESCFPNHDPCSPKHEPISPKYEPEPSDEYSRSSSSENTTVECSNPQSPSEYTEIHTKRARVSGKTATKDETYFERRKKNNLAAKKSRDAKRAREKQTKKELIILQAENEELKAALSNCVCGAFKNAATVFIRTPYNFPVPYQEPRLFRCAQN